MQVRLSMYDLSVDTCTNGLHYPEIYHLSAFCVPYWILFDTQFFHAPYVYLKVRSAIYQSDKSCSKHQQSFYAMLIVYRKFLR